MELENSWGDPKAAPLTRCVGLSALASWPLTEGSGKIMIVSVRPTIVKIGHTVDHSFAGPQRRAHALDLVPRSLGRRIDLGRRSFTTAQAIDLIEQAVTNGSIAGILGMSLVISLIQVARSPACHRAPGRRR